MMKMKYWFLTTMLFGLSLYGCQNNLAYSSESAPVIENGSSRARLVIGSDNLTGKITIKNPIFRSLGQLTQAQVMVLNATATRYTLEYKFNWEDKQGFKADSINSWHRFTLTPGETRTFTSTGKVPEATHIVFTVRLPDDAFIENEKHMLKQEMNKPIENIEGEKQ
ncbi:MAG: hypothetical protein BMS9Abin25_0721 [Gammaproteobacteria bacterium]|nr:MAG: hypothetical protein BMS9Abin25_0721 [Gammaproteobacteria bacterium]